MTTTDDSRRLFFKHAGMQLVAGGSAGCVEVSLMHPLDLVKTRFQLQSNPKTMARIGAGNDILTHFNNPANHHQHYSGVADCLKKMYQTEGLLSFWKGILPPILVETPKRAWKFLTFEQFKRLFDFSQKGQPVSPLTYSLAGLGSGMTEAILVNPFEAVKVRMQSCRAHQKHSLSTGAVVKQIIGNEGLTRGILLKGLTSGIGRNGTFNMCYFGFYHSIKDIVPQYENPTTEFAKKFAIGLIAGCFGSCANIPFDVAKSRIQGPQPIPGQVKYKTLISTIATVYKEEGFFALYKGLLPKMMRLGPGGAIMLIVYETVYGYLKETYPD